MNNPIKIIWKYKNKHRRIQYNTYIFVGPISNDLDKILIKISDLSLYKAWVTLLKTDISVLEKKYGNTWYTYFYNAYHISNTVNIVRESNAQLKELSEKYGDEWIKTHISANEILNKKILYSYEALFKDEQGRKKIKKNRTMGGLHEDDTNIDYKMNKIEDIKNILEKRKTQEGGAPDGVDDVAEVDDQNDENSNPFEDGINIDEYVSPDEEFDMQEIEDLYEDIDVEPDKNVTKTAEMIQQALNDDKLFEKKTQQLIEFDQSKNNTIYDENLRDVYKKYYVKNYYIFRDDTIKVVRDKICASLKNNAIFGKNSYIIPSRQYLWSQYQYDNKIQKIMIGQKWVKRNEILSIDIEPNTNIHNYEELRGSLSKLRDDIKRYGNKIRREDDDTSILYEYEDYFSNNELFMIDIYNELGKGYTATPEIQKNLQDVYLKIYFPKIRHDEFKYILDYLNNNSKSEYDKSILIYETITNDMVMESEIMYMVENTKQTTDYKKVFKDNYITQSVIHVNLRLAQNSGKIDLYRIFNEFIPSPEHPFIQYQTPDGQIVFKYNEKEISDYLKIKDNADVLSKWFENAPYGISFKVKIKERGIEKFMAINLNDSGKIEYKTQWKEDDMATIDDIKKTYEYVRKLIRIVNKNNSKVAFSLPDDQEFKYAFINTIQKFELPENQVINHNDLSEFSRYFYPYVALVIEPRKRLAKIQKNNDKSKFGTYLRYKRVSKYENQARIEQRIMYFMRNYEYQEQLLANEISKQFNITEDKAKEEIERVKNKYPNLKKSRKVLKKLENIPKYKPPGIGIDIQGKQREKYKIRISGARDRPQLDRIISFMNILIYLYIDTYLLKNPERQILKEKLKKLNNIARRRNKVDEIVDYSRELKTVKQMAQIDKRRIGFKPEKGQNQWTRACQNSGNDKKRRPQQYVSSTMDQLINKGYKFNAKTGEYERKIPPKGKNGKEIILKTIKLQEYDEEGNPTGNDIHYACSPEENGEHMYVGFLTRSTNPFGQCMPCCFKKDSSISKNKEKRDFHLKCLGQKNGVETDVNQILKSTGDKLYILQDTNKIQEGRFGFLPKYLDYYFNLSLNKTKKIKHHYLIKSETGYFFKYGTKQDEYQFINSVAAIMELDVASIKNKMTKVLQEDKNNIIFTSLNNGDIRSQYLTRDKYIDYIKYSSYLDFDISNDLLSMPGVLTKEGLNIIVFQKKTVTIKRTFEKEKTKEDFYILCQNNEEVERITDPRRSNIFILKENSNYYPIVMVQKINEDSKTMDIIKLFKYDANDKTNIVNHVKPFYNKNCSDSLVDDIIHKNSSLTAKMTYSILTNIGDKNYNVKYQHIDMRNKCNYLITASNIIVPVRPSGSIYNVQMITDIDKYVDTFDNTLKNINVLYNKVKKQHYLPIKPIGVYYDERHGKIIRIIALMTKTKDIIPIKPVEKNVSDIEKMDLIYENKPLYDKIDIEIAKGKQNQIIDSRIMQVNESKYNDESYELFKLELSDYINKPNNAKLKQSLENIINDTKNSKKNKVEELEEILYKLVDDELYNIFKKSMGMKGGGELINVTDQLPDLATYNVKNDRELCGNNDTKDKCNTNIHCRWNKDKCKLNFTREMAIDFVNKLSSELVQDDMKAQEIFQNNGYYVSDIVDHSRFKEMSGQKIIRSSNNMLKKTLGELFGKDNTPKIGRRKIPKQNEDNNQQLNADNNMRDMKDYYMQNIMNDNLVIFRSFANGYYWIKYPYFNLEGRNLGFYSQLQSDLAIYFRSMVIDWLSDSKNSKMIYEDLSKYMDSSRKGIKNSIDDYIVKLVDDSNVTSNYIVELYILNKIQDIPIVVHDDNNNLIYLYDGGLLYNIRDSKKIDVKKFDRYENDKNIIHMRFNMQLNSIVPDKIYVVYNK